MHARHLTRFGLMAATLLVAGVVWGQQPPGGGFPGGGGGGRGNFRFDPGMFFDRIANGRTTIAISEVPSRPNDPSAQERLQQWAAQNGITNGQLTREQFTSYLEARRAERRANGQGGGPPGAAPVMPAAPGAPVPTPQGPGGAAPAEGAAPIVPATEPEEESRPTVHRPGKLPKGLPDWFAKLDTDGDGQIGLYEWKEAGRSLDEFRKLDRNGDGFITVEEALRASKTATASSGGTGRTARPGEDAAEESSSVRTTTGNAVTSNANAQPNRRVSDGSRPWQNGRRRGNNRPSSGGGQQGNEPPADDN
jgi:hypothetical protein